MISILIVDDSADKIKVIENSIKEEISKHHLKIYIANDIISALNQLKQYQFDLMILDIFLPNRFGEDPIEDGGLKLLKRIESNNKYGLPFHIIGLSYYDDIVKKYETEFKKSLWHLIKFIPNANEWELQLKSKINYLIKSKYELKNSNSHNYDYDIAIVTALHNYELSFILDLPCDWREFKINNDYLTYHIGILKNENKSFRIVAVSPNQMGVGITTLITSKIINNFHPKYIIMSGKAAGIIRKGVNYGDILISSLSWDYSSGKLSEKKGSEIFQPDNVPIPLNVDILAYFNEAISGKLFLSEIKKSWKGEDFGLKLNAHIGPFATGPLVITSKNKIEQIKGHQRKLIGIDMESYAIFFTCYHSTHPRPIAFTVKSISDFANTEKSDKYEKYACFTSSQYIFHFILKFLEPVS